MWSGMATKTNKKKPELTDDMLRELDELTDILSGYFSIGKETYQIKKREKNVKRNRNSKKS